MKKINSEYFQHEIFASYDPKITALLREHGAAGYGIFWRIVEMMHASELRNSSLELKEFTYLSIAEQLKVVPESVELLIQDCIKRYELFKNESELFWSERVLINIQKRNEISLKRSESGRNGAIAKQKNTSAEQILASASQLPLNYETIETDKLETIEKEFYVFWDLYANKKGSKKCLAKWIKLTDNQRKLAIEKTPEYVATIKDKTYQKHPLTYLNGEHWNDELTNNGIKQIDQSDPIAIEREARRLNFEQRTSIQTHLKTKPIDFNEKISIYHVNFGRYDERK